MIPFKFFINENFMIARTNMPQIEDTGDFLSYLESIEVGYTKHISSVRHFKPTQAEGFNEYKIRNISMDMRKDPDSIPSMKPIIVSNDGYVLDGHHRYLAAIREEENIPFIVVDTTINKLLKISYDYSTRRDKEA